MQIQKKTWNATIISLSQDCPTKNKTIVGRKNAAITPNGFYYTKIYKKGINNKKSSI